MNIIIDLLTAPVLGPIRGVTWLGEKMAEAAREELLDEGRVRGQLLELQIHLDMGEITEEEYAGQEKGLLEWLDEIRKMKAEQVGP